MERTGTILQWKTGCASRLENGEYPDKRQVLLYQIRFTDAGHGVIRG